MNGPNARYVTRLLSAAKNLCCYLSVKEDKSLVVGKILAEAGAICPIRYDAMQCVTCMPEFRSPPPGDSKCCH